MNTTLPPSPVLVKEGVEGAPVGSGPFLQNQKPTLNTPLEADHPGPAELSSDQPTQTQFFGIGNILIEGRRRKTRGQGRQEPNRKKGQGAVEAHPQGKGGKSPKQK